MQLFRDYGLRLDLFLKKDILDFLHSFPLLASLQLMLWKIIAPLLINMCSFAISWIFCVSLFSSKCGYFLFNETEQAVHKCIYFGVVVRVLYFLSPNQNIHYPFGVCCHPQNTVRFLFKRLPFSFQVVLSKFVRQMGDLLPSTIYIPYLKMLRGLASGPQCAHYCFSLLKVNGSSHGKKGVWQ